MAQKVKDVMTSDLVTVPSDASLINAARLMRQHGIGDVFVVNGDRLEGLVTDRDIVVRAVAAERDMARTPVSDVCSRDLVSVASGDDADSVVNLMRDRGIRRVPVVDKGRPVGVVSLGDMAIERDRRSVLAQISEKPPND